jgi:hypothetical protein
MDVAANQYGLHGKEASGVEQKQTALWDKVKSSATESSERRVEKKGASGM